MINTDNNKDWSDQLAIIARNLTGPAFVITLCMEEPCETMST